MKEHKCKFKTDKITNTKYRKNDVSKKAFSDQPLVCSQSSLVFSLRRLYELYIQFIFRILHFSIFKIFNNSMIIFHIVDMAF